MENKCKQGYKLDDGKCKKKKGIFSNLPKFKNPKMWWIISIVAIIIIILVLVLVFNFDGIKNMFSISGGMPPAPTGAGGGG